MATLNLSLTVPDAIAADLVATIAAAADDAIRPANNPDGTHPAAQVAYDALTAAQKAKQYVAFLVREVYKSRKQAAAQTTASAEVAAAMAQATSDAAGVS